MSRHIGRSTGWQPPSNNQRKNGRRNPGQGRNRFYRGKGNQGLRGLPNKRGAYRTPRVTTTSNVRQLNVDDESANLTDRLHIQEAYKTDSVVRRVYINNPVVPHLSIPVALKLTRTDKVRVGLLDAGAEVSCLDVSKRSSRTTSSLMTADFIPAFAVNRTELNSVGSLSLEIEFDRQVHGHVQFYVFKELETDILLRFGIRTNVPDRIIEIQGQPFASNWLN
jgi:hypothetical protein